jgi:PadR family transcriptional regulator, regulatory protein AphA
VSSPAQQLTTTSYAVLGLLCLRDWSAYELVTEMDRGWSDIWPRAVSGIYREPRKLVGHRLATSRTEHTGQRPRTVYSATAEGRAAFRDWLATSSGEPRLEAEVLVRTGFAEHGSLEDLLSAARHARAFAVERSRLYVSIGDEYRREGPRFPQRVHSILLVGGFLARYFSAIIDWADWVETHAAAWDDIADAKTIPDLDALRADVRARLEANLAEPSHHGPIHELPGP